MWDKNEFKTHGSYIYISNLFLRQNTQQQQMKKKRRKFMRLQSSPGVRYDGRGSQEAHRQQTVDLWDQWCCCSGKVCLEFYHFLFQTENKQFKRDWFLILKAQLTMKVRTWWHAWLCKWHKLQAKARLIVDVYHSAWAEDWGWEQ